MDDHISHSEGISGSLGCSRHQKPSGKQFTAVSSSHLTSVQAKVLGNVSGLANLLLFVILLTFLCAIFAVQLVRGDIPAEMGGETLPITFHTLYNAFLGMYQIFSSEDWTSVLYITTEVQSPFGVGWISAMFFIGWFILGNCKY